MMREMKDSGVEWIGEIPEDWETIRLKTVILQSNAGEVIDKGFWNDGEELLYTCQKTPMNSNYLGFPDNKRTSEWDLLLTRNATPYIFVPENNSIYSNVVQRIRIHTAYNRNYIRFALQCGAESLTAYGDTIPSYNMQIWRNISIPNISFSEQIRIADYLDDKCAKIDAIIAREQAVIEKLKAYKLSVITETVTKGLNPDVPMKDSGIKWAAEMPSSWENRKMISILSMRVVDGPHESPELFNDGIPYISATAIENGKINFDLMRGYISNEYCDFCDLRYKPKLHDILVIKLGASTGQVAIVETRERFNIWVPLAAVRCNDEANPYFVYYAFQSDYFWRQMELSWTFGTQQTLGVKTIERLRILLPPIGEQERIVDYLKIKCKGIDIAISKKQAIVDKLTEYKKSLIYEIVTGKKEV